MTVGTASGTSNVDDGKMVGITSVFSNVADAVETTIGVAALGPIVETGIVCVLQPKSDKDNVVISINIRIVFFFCISHPTVCVTRWRAG